MEQAEELEAAALAQEPFPVTHSTFQESGQRAALDDPRLADREAGSSLPDQEITGQAIFALAEDGRLNLGDGLDARIRVKTEGQIVTITGVVDSAGQRMAAEELVEAIPGVRLVQNALTVSVDSYLEDKELAREVRKRLDEAGFAWVGARVSRGTARLVGVAEKLADEERAVQVAAWVKGIGDVVSNIKVRMPEYTDEIDLLSLLTQNLALNEIVVLDREVGVSRDGLVRISGEVQSLRDCRRIRRIIAEIPGVRAIKEELRVNHAIFHDWQARTHLSTGR